MNTVNYVVVVVVLAKLRERVLETLHEGYIGMVKMKGLSWGFVWWPNIDKDIEGAVQSCEGCQESANNPARAPLHRWEYSAVTTCLKFSYII